MTSPLKLTLNFGGMAQAKDHAQVQKKASGGNHRSLLHGQLPKEITSAAP
jgi:hypothetical protein